MHDPEKDEAAGRLLVGGATVLWSSLGRLPTRRSMTEWSGITRERMRCRCSRKRGQLCTEMEAVELNQRGAPDFAGVAVAV